MARQPAKTLQQVEQDLEAKDVPKNEKKREMLVEMMPNGLYQVRMDGGGKIPALLEGSFTSISKVNQLIEVYNASK